MILYAAAQIYQAMQYIDQQGKQSLLKTAIPTTWTTLALLRASPEVRPRRQPVPCALPWRAEETATAIPRAPGGVLRVRVLPRTNTQRSRRAAPRWRWRPPAPKPEAPATADRRGAVTIVDLSYVAWPTPQPRRAGRRSRGRRPVERVFWPRPIHGGTRGQLPIPRQGVQPGHWGCGHTSDQEAGTVILFHHGRRSKAWAEMINGLKGYLQDKTIRPMTDLVNVSAPEEVPYTIGLTYYIGRQRQGRDHPGGGGPGGGLSNLAAGHWTGHKPSKLVAMVMEAGASGDRWPHTAVAATTKCPPSRGGHRDLEGWRMIPFRSRFTDIMPENLARRRSRHCLRGGAAGGKAVCLFRCRPDLRPLPPCRSGGCWIMAVSCTRPMMKGCRSRPSGLD